MKLRTPQEHDDEVRRLSATKNLTGVACPNCETEMQYVSPGIYMLSSPMQAHVKCFECNYETNIYVLYNNWR